MAERINRDRIQRAKGSQPVVFESQTVDALAAMVIALLGEVAVLRDRLDANERLLETAGLHGPDKVDAFQPDAPAKARRAEVRNASYNRVLGAGRDKLVPDLLTEQQQYDATLSAGRTEGKEPKMLRNAPDHYGHAVMPQANHDEQALEDHFLALREWTARNLDPLDRRLLDEVVVPEVAEKLGRAPGKSSEVRRALEAEPFHQYWLTLTLAYQDRMWHAIDESIDRQYDTLAAEVGKHVAAPLGSLRLDPEFVAPRYITAIDNHRMPGSYMVDTAENDFRAGALYDRFSSTYLRNFNGGWKNDGRGHTVASHVMDFYPDLKPKRILDLGCSIGQSTVALAAAFPEAEIYGVDVGAPMLRYGHARAEALGAAIHFSQQNAEHTDFPDGSFDLVCSAAVLHETSTKGMRAIFKESHRMLRPGGVMVHVDVPARHEHLGLWDQMRLDWESHYNNEPFMTVLARTDWMEVAKAAGFAEEKTAVGYRRGVRQLDPKREDFFTEGHPEGRTMMGTWYACSSVKD